MWILLPICVDENHWVLLAANKSTRSVGILNSLPGYSAAEERYCSHFMYVLHFLLFHIKDMGTCMYVKGGGWGVGCGGVVVVECCSDSLIVGRLERRGIQDTVVRVNVVTSLYQI